MSENKMKDSKLEETIRKGISRRDFLKTSASFIFLGGVSYAFKGCSSPSSPPSDTPVTYSGHLQGLFNGSPVSSGEIIFNHATTIPIIGGSYNIVYSEHNLTEGNYHVRIETAEGLPREVSNAHLDNSGLYNDKSNLRLDNVIEKNAVDINEYNYWLRNGRSERWLTNTPRFFLYDNSLWRRNGGVLEIINNNYDVDPMTIASVEDVVNNDIHLYTSGFAHGQLLRESQSSERPDPNTSPSGWIIYMVRDDIKAAIEKSHAPGDDGDIFYGYMGFDTRFIHRGAISIDTAETLGIGQDYNAGEVTTGSPNYLPSPKAQRISKIIYNRAPHHEIIGDIDTEE